MKGVHLTLSLAFFAFAWFQFRYHGALPLKEVGFRYNYYVILAYGVCLLFFLRTYSAYLLGYSRIRSMVFAQFISQLFSAAILYFAVSLAWNRFDRPLAFLLVLPAQLLLDMIWSYLANAYYFRLNPQKKTVLIYRAPLDKLRFGSIRGKPTERLYRITDEIMYNGNFDEIRDRLAGYDAVFVAGVNSACRNGILKYCKEENIPGFFLPHIGDTIMQDARHIRSFNSPVLYVERKILNPEYAFVKRAFDIAASLLGVILFSPVMLFAAIAIKAADGGPVIYSQMRLTKDSREFRILKFRTMRVDAEKDGVARLSTGEGDDRITSVGRVLRKCRLDELPQLVNILRGDMSFVGPRPERPEIAQRYYQTMPDFALRLQVRAGLTGYAQVYGKYNTDPYEKLAFDLLYINRMSILNDIQLLLATFPVLFSRESTEGVAPGAVTAMEHEPDS